MKRAILLTVLVLIVVTLGTYLIFSKPTTSPNPNPINQFPVSTSTGTNGTGTETHQAEIKADFLAQIQHADLISTGNSVVVANYALQLWWDQNKGGEALLRYDSGKGWTLISLGGGAWDVPSLMKAGVSQAIAEQLAAQAQ